MKIIPYQFQELESVCNAITNQELRCVTFMSLTGNAGASSLSKSVACGLSSQKNRVLLIDLNPLNPIGLPSDTHAKFWQFDDISCQLCTIESADHDLLTISHLSELESAKNKRVIQYAVERLLQEYDYILIDMSPALKLNQGNIPLYALSSCSQMTIIVAALGYNDEESFCTALKYLKDSGHQNIKVVVSQYHFEPLGEKMLTQLNKINARWPRLSNWLSIKLQQQRWLFHNH